MKRKKPKKRLKDRRGWDSNRLKNVNRYNRLKFKLHADCLLDFRSLEGTRTVPSPVVTEMITALYNRNFETEMEEYKVRKFATQLLSMLGLIAIFNNDRRVCIDKVFQLHCYPEKMQSLGGGSRYVFSMRTTMKPEYLTSYLHQLLFESETIEEIGYESTELEELFSGYLKGLLGQSEEE